MDITGHRFGDLMVNENDEIMAVFFGPPFTTSSSEFYLMNLTNGASAKEAIMLSDGSSKFFGLFRAAFIGNKVTVLIHTAGTIEPVILVNYDVSNGNIWIRQPQKPSLIGDFVQDMKGNTLFMNTFPDGFYDLQLFSIDSLGGLNWSNSLRLFKPGFDDLRFEANEIGFLPGEAYYISGKFDTSNGSGQEEYFIMKLNLDGTPSIMKTIGEHAINQLYVSKEGIYLLGKSTAAFSFTDNKGNAVLAKFTPDLELEWANIYHGQAFEYANATLNLAPDGTLVLGYSTFGAFPVVLARLDGEGNILWQRGYPLYEPEIDAFSDGALLLTTRRHFDSTGALFTKRIIAKTDPDGNIPNCPTFPACLESNPITLELGSFEAEVLPGDTLIPLHLDVEPAQFSFSDFCDIPPPPSPNFIFPDTLCFGDSSITVDTYNKLAQKNEWHLSGVNTDITWTDSSDFYYRFQTPGEYNLTQTVWFLGCNYTFNKNIRVLDELKANIDKSGVICESPPAQLLVESNRQINKYLWNSGDTVESIKAAQEGIYSVLVDDGFCQAFDTTSIRFITSILGNQSALVVPDDMVVCVEDLPFPLYPNSNFTNHFFLNGLPLEQLPVPIDTSGHYRISMFLEGCPFSEDFFLSVDDCKSRIYFPTAFSPNDDGINDEFYPQGVGFLPIQLSIFDRWGGLIAKLDGANPKWDGSNMQQGVYVFLFEFFNLYNNRSEQLHGAVTLVR
jgi:gliding motility-associated-like protein